jgi:hypothetical protein
LAHADDGYKVVNRIDPLKGFVDRRGVSYIPDLQLDVRTEISRASPLGTMHLRAEVVKYPDAVAIVQQLIRKMRTDESSATGY